MSKLASCPKGHSLDQDKTMPPAETVARVRRVLADKGPGVLAETQRIDTGRLGIPVFLSHCGPAARTVMPTRKQMGKGASPEQAEASALMELVERYSFFSFFADQTRTEVLTFGQAREKWPGQVIPLAEMLAAVDEKLPDAAALEILNLAPMRFAPAVHVASGQTRYLPVDFFKLLNEFNGSSAGNALTETALQGGCELVERHVSAVVDLEHPELPTIDPASFGHPVVDELVNCFASNGVVLVLKDFSLGMPVPTVGALAWDPSTFPSMSEIVLTAGTATDPAKAAVRALTEVAQLAGDFHTGSTYEASGLSKYLGLDDVQWLTAGPTVAASALPDIGADDMQRELEALASGLQGKGFPLYAVDTTSPDLELPAVYMISPGMKFRERHPKPCLGLYVGRMLAENAEPGDAVRGLKILAKHYPDEAFLPFFQGLAALRGGDAEVAAIKFASAADMGGVADDVALASFYAGHALVGLERFDQALPHLDRAIEACDEVKEYFNMRGVARFKMGDYALAATDFEAALDLDAGSAMDMANLGLCRKFQGQTDAAIRCLTKALEMDTSLDFARQHLAELEG